MSSVVEVSAAWSPSTTPASQPVLSGWMSFHLPIRGWTVNEIPSTLGPLLSVGWDSGGVDRLQGDKAPHIPLLALTRGRRKKLRSMPRPDVLASTWHLDGHLPLLDVIGVGHGTVLGSPAAHTELTVQFITRAVLQSPRARDHPGPGRSYVSLIPAANAGWPLLIYGHYGSGKEPPTTKEN